MEPKHAEYFEGVLQLRDPNTEVIEFIHELFTKREYAFISKELKVRGGIDFYVSSQKYLRGLANVLQGKFGGDIKISRRLHTRDKQSSKDLYRCYLMFRPSKYQKGDIIKYNGEDIKIISAVKEIFGINQTTNKKVHIKFDRL